MSTSGGNTVIATSVAIASAAIVGICLSQTLAKKRHEAKDTTPDAVIPQVVAVTPMVPPMVVASPAVVAEEIKVSYTALFSCANV